MTMSNQPVDLKQRRLMNDKDALQAAMVELTSRAVEARTDVGKFFEFVMREETTRKPIKLLPHQRILLDFMLQHDRSVNMVFVGSSKTFITACLTLWLLGRNPTTRGMVVSATEAQAAKVLKMVGDYIHESLELRLVFPNLQPSTKRGHQWTQTAITVERPPGIRDASLQAVGQGSDRIAGSRLNWVIVDDLLSWENCNTREQREKVHNWLNSECLTRLDDVDRRIVVTNTPRHPDDMMHHLEANGWPTLRMDILGNVSFQDDLERLKEGKPPWSHPGLRLAHPGPSVGPPVYRLKAHDPDPQNVVPLWPAKWGEKKIAELRATQLPHIFNQMYLNLCRDDAAAMCKAEWVETCKANARAAKHFQMTSQYRGANPTFMGVDLAFRKGENADYTAFFTFEQLPDGKRKILDVEFGQFDAAAIVDKMFQKQVAYQSVVRVENNAAQDIVRQMALSRNASFPIYAHTTGHNKANLDFGVQQVFIDMMNGAWLIPNDERGRMHPAVKKWVDECLYYTPSAHSGDVLMASWFAWFQCRDWGMLGGGTPTTTNETIGMEIMSR